MRLNRRSRFLPTVRTIALLVALIGLTMSEQAIAYPQFQLATGNVRCSQCHYNPAGAGLIRPYGRDEATGTLSMFEGRSGLLWDLADLPEWLDIGGDFRFAGIVKKTSDDPQILGFPMQGDLYARLALGAFSVNGTLGVRAAARTPRASVADRLGSREHYAMWSPDDDTGLYVRAGRFFAPFGLRLQDHSSYVRRYLGQHTLEETYNVSIGTVDDAWEVHGTLFVPPSTLSLGDDIGNAAIGGALYYERRAHDDKLAWAAQTKVEVFDESQKFWLGGIGKLWIESANLLLLSEIDVGMQRFSFDADARMQLAAHLGATYMITQGLSVGTMLERYDPDIALKGSGRNSANLTVQWFPYPHFELVLMGRVETQGGLSDPNPLALAMFHYYL